MQTNKYFILFAVSLIISVSSPLAGGDEAGDYQFGKKFAFSFSGTWNYLNNGKLNGDYIETWKSWGYLDDKINFGYGLTSEAIYFLSPKISLAAGLVYIGGSTEKDQNILDNVNNVTIVVHDYVKSRLYGPSVSVRYHVRRDEANYSLGIRETLLLGRVSRRHTWNPYLMFGPIENDFKSTGFGFQIFGGIHYRLNDIISYTMDIGYSKLETGDLVEDESEVVLRAAYPFNGDPINLDYSGPYVSTGLLFRLF